MAVEGKDMDFDYKKEKEEFIAELKAGEYDLEILPNEEIDYEQSINDDFIAFGEHLKADCSKTLMAETFKK
jgi:hypothetical protein